MTDDRRKRWLGILGGVLFVSGAALVTRHVVVKHQRERTARETIAKLQAELDALRPKGRTDVHATVNGVVSHITFATSPQKIGAAADAVADTCGNDAETGGADVVAVGDSPPKRFVREAVRRQDVPDGSAAGVLCIFRATDTGERFERFTFIRGNSEGSSLTHVTRQSKADISVMFPAEGDAPGGDLDGVPRPEGSRRVLTATVAETGHAVRIYDVPRKGLPAEELRSRRDAVDRQMRAAGFEPSAAVAQGIEDTRLYVRGSDRIIVAFEPGDEVTRIVINRANLL